MSRAGEVYLIDQPELCRRGTHDLCFGFHTEFLESDCYYGNGNDPASGLTTASGLTFRVPSATTLSPACKPSSITQNMPMRSPTFTGRMLTWLSTPTTA